MPSAISVVTLLTDFGTHDHFVASMKGVILGINNHARVIDISHTVEPYSVEQAAFLLNSCYHYFPDGTVHVVVVDPGVGSTRRGLLVTTSRFFFIAPDNGVLTYIFENEVSVEVRQIENRQLRLDSEGATFEGRDLFAPSAAWLTRGQTPGTYGRLVADYEKLQIQKPEVRGGALHGRVAYIDHFGNIITDVTPTDIQTLRQISNRKNISLEIGNFTIDTLHTHYQQGSSEQPGALINSNGYLEVFIKEKNAANILGVTTGTSVEIH